MLLIFVEYLWYYVIRTNFRNLCTTNDVGKNIFFVRKKKRQREEVCFRFYHKSIKFIELFVS